MGAIFPSIPNIMGKEEYYLIFCRKTESGYIIVKKKRYKKKKEPFFDLKMNLFKKKTKTFYIDLSLCSFSHMNRHALFLDIDKSEILTFSRNSLPITAGQLKTMIQTKLAQSILNPSIDINLLALILGCAFFAVLGWILGNNWEAIISAFNG